MIKTYKKIIKMSIPSLRALAASKIIETPHLYSTIEKETEESTIIDMDSKAFIEIVKKYLSNIAAYFSAEHFSETYCSDLLRLYPLKDPDKTLNNQDLFIAAAKNGRTEMLEPLIAMGAGVDIQGKNGSTALMRAARHGHTETVKALKEMGAGLDIQDNDGFTALIRAALTGHTETVKALIAMGAGVDIQGKNGSTALMAAAFYGKTRWIRYSRCAGVDIQNNDGKTALMLAARDGLIDTVKALIDMGAGVDILDNSGSTALMKAAWAGHTEIAKALIDRGAGVDIQDNDGKTALMRAARHGHTETEKALKAEKTKLYYKKLKSTCYKISLSIIFCIGAYLLSRYNRSSFLEDISN